MGSQMTKEDFTWEILLCIEMMNAMASNLATVSSEICSAAYKYQK
jgi:hypothetical protein